MNNNKQGCIISVHYFKLNNPDWSLSTAHLSAEEEGIYFRLIRHYYDTESPIPLETESVYRRLRLSEHSEKANQILAEFFTRTEKGFVSRRCEKTIAEYRKNAKANRLNGKKGGRPSKYAASSDNPTITEQKPGGLFSLTEKKGNQEPLTINHKPLTKEKGARFAKPSIEDLINEFSGRVFEPVLEAQKFLSHYESNGWKVGRNPMKSWKHAVTNWITRGNENGNNQNHPRKLTRDEEIERASAEYLRSMGIQPVKGNPDGRVLEGTYEVETGTRPTGK